MKKETSAAKPRHFSAYQLMCIVGRLQDYAKSKGVEWDNIYKDIQPIVLETDNKGEADMVKAEVDGCAFINKHAEEQNAGTRRSDQCCRGKTVVLCKEAGKLR